MCKIFFRDAERELKKIDSELNVIEGEIQKLNEKKRKLLKRKETLKQQANEEATKKLASQDWETSGQLYTTSSIISQVS